MSRQLTAEEVDMLWDIKSLAYDFYGSALTVNARNFAKAIQQTVDNLLKAQGLNPVVHTKGKVD